MFLKELFKYSKAACFIVIGFLLAFIYIFFKWGIVAAPVLQYGMYSAPVHMGDTQEVYLIEVNNKPLNCGALSFMDRDILQVSLADYEKQAAVNSSVYNTMHKFLGFTGLMDQRRYSNHLTDADFTRWYKAKLEKIAGGSVDSLLVYKQYYLWRQNNLQPVGSPIKLAFIVP